MGHLFRAWPFLQAVALVALLAPASHRAGAETAPAWKAARAGQPDIELTLRARLALQQTESIPGTVGVSVQDGVATLWGAVPSPAAARHAREVISQLPGVAQVRDELHVEPEGQPTHDPLTGSFGPPARRAEPLVPFMPRTRGSLVGRPADGGAGPDRDALWRPPATPPVPVPNNSPQVLPGMPEQVVPFLPLRSGRPTSPGRTAGLGTEGALLLPPIRIPAPPRPQPDQPMAASPPPLAGQVMRLCQGDARYQGLYAEVRDGVVFLIGTVTTWEDVHEAAQAIGVLPGVRRVVLESVRLKP